MKIKLKIKAMALCLAVVMAFSGVYPAVLAEEDTEDIRIINTVGAVWGAFGQYVEYEIDGYTYNTKTAPPYKNLEAWRRMTDKQKRMTYNALFTTAAKKAAFGQNGSEEISLWNKQSSSYYKANKLWKARIAKRDYPKLTAMFGQGRSLATLYPEYTEISSYEIPAETVWWERAKTFQTAIAAVEKEYQVGREYYEKTVEMRTNGIANVVTITITQCTLMLSDMLFVPSVTKGAANEASSQIADIFNVLTGFASMEDSDFNEKFIRYKNGETGVPFTPEETVKLYGALMDTYAKMAENSLPRIDAAMKKLKNRYELLKAGHQFYLNELELKEREKAQAKVAYEEALLEKYPRDPILPSGNYEGLNFSWFTAEQLANQYGASMNYTDMERKAAVFDAVLTKKAELDAEAGSDALILCQNMIDAYNGAADCLAQKALELGLLESEVENGCSPETISSYTSVDWDGDGYGDFMGNSTFEEALWVGGNIVSLFKESWPTLLQNLEVGKSSLEVLKFNIKGFTDYKDTLASEINPYLTDLSSYMEQLQQLNEDYWELYNSVVWVPEGYDPDRFINPIHHEDYQINAVSDAYAKVSWPEDETLYSDVVNKTVASIEKLQSEVPLSIYNRAYEIYETVAEKLDFMEDSQKTVKEYYNNFLSDETAYYHELDTRLNAYLKLQENMAEKFEQINQSTLGYESLWNGAFFKGDGDYSRSYHHGTTIINYSSFDADGIRSYLRGGGSRFALLYKIRELADYAAAHEAIIQDLLAQINMLKMEMDALGDALLSSYATKKGVEYKSFYHFRDEYDNINWIRINNSTYFDLNDIEYIIDDLSGEGEEIRRMKDYRSELLGYLGTSSVNTVKVSNRMYDIYKYASRVYDVFSSSYFYNKSLLTDEQINEVLNIYRSGTGVGDIEGTLYDITDKHEGTAYGLYNLPSDNGTDSYAPLGDFGDSALSGDKVGISAPLYHPFTSGVTSASATVYSYSDNGWEPLGGANEIKMMNEEDSDSSYLLQDNELKLFEAENNVEIVIDKQNDTISLYSKGLENNTDYRFEWNITYTYDGTVQNETGDVIKTITYEPSVVAKAALEEDSCTSAVVDVTNLTESVLSGSYVYVNGYGEDGELIAIVGRALAPLEMMETAKMTLTFDKPVYSVSAYVGEAESTAPSTIIIKKDGATACNIISERLSILQYSTEVFDSLGNSLSGINVTWSVVPSGVGVNVENGTVTIGENTPAGSYTITASAGGTAYDEIILTIEDFVPQSKLIFNGLTKNGNLITGGLTLQIINNNPELESCDIVIGVYEKGKNKLEALTKDTVQLNKGTNRIDIDDLSFSVEPVKTYEVRIFSFTSLASLRPVANVFKVDM